MPKLTTHEKQLQIGDNEQSQIATRGQEQQSASVHRMAESGSENRRDSGASNNTVKSNGFVWLNDDQFKSPFDVSFQTLYVPLSTIKQEPRDEPALGAKQSSAGMNESSMCNATEMEQSRVEQKVIFEIFRPKKTSMKSTKAAIELFYLKVWREKFVSRDAVGSTSRTIRTPLLAKFFLLGFSWKTWVACIISDEYRLLWTILSYFIATFVMDHRFRSYLPNAFKQLFFFVYFTELARYFASMVEFQWSQWIVPYCWISADGAKCIGDGTKTCEFFTKSYCLLSL